MTTDSQPTEATAAEKAAEIVAALDRRLAALDERLATNKRTRDELVFAANTGDSKAKKQLGDLGDEKRRVEDERTDLLTAIQIGRQKHLQAVQAEALEAGRELAREVDAMFEGWAEISEVMDNARNALVNLGRKRAERPTQILLLGSRLRKSDGVQPGSWRSCPRRSRDRRGAELHAVCLFRSRRSGLQGKGPDRLHVRAVEAEGPGRLLYLADFRHIARRRRLSFNQAVWNLLPAAVTSVARVRRWGLLHKLAARLGANQDGGGTRTIV
jgi:hypothetical protein